MLLEGKVSRQAQHVLGSCKHNTILWGTRLLLGLRCPLHFFTLSCAP